MKLSNSTQYPELLAPNGMVVGPGMIAVQSGIDVLQNGGTAADSCVAAALTHLVVAGYQSPTLSLNVLVHGSGLSSPLTMDLQRERLPTVLRGWHILLNRFGYRSLYDLALWALQYASAEVKSPHARVRDGLLASAGPASLSELLTRTEGLSNLDDGAVWRHAWQSEGEDLTWVSGGAQLHTSSVHLAAVDNRGQSVSMLLTRIGTDTNSRASPLVPRHCLATREAKLCMVCGVSGGSHSDPLSNFLSDLRRGSGMGVQEAVEAGLGSDESTLSDRQPNAKVSDERTAVGVIVVDRRRGILIGGQAPHRGTNAAGY